MFLAPTFLSRAVCRRQMAYSTDGDDLDVGSNSELAGTYSVLTSPLEITGIVPGGNQFSSPPDMAGLYTQSKITRGTILIRKCCCAGWGTDKSGARL